MCVTALCSRFLDKSHDHYKLFFLKRTLPTWSLHVSMNSNMERKRNASQRTAVETSTEGGSRSTKHSKLVLKPPKFITAPHRTHEELQAVKTLSSQLEEVLTVETPEDALEQLLRVCNLFLPTLEHISTEDGAKSLGALKRLWEAHMEGEGSMAICSVLIRLLGLLAMNEGSEWEGAFVKQMQEFAIKTTEHGEARVVVD